MDNINTEHSHGENGPAKAVSQLSASIAQTTESHRALIQEITQFAKDEGLRFANLRLERNSDVLEKLQNAPGLPGILGVQQEWLRDVVQDYISHNLRVAGALRGVSQNVLATASEHAAQNIDRAQHQASDMAHQAAEQMGHVPQDVNNNYVQH